MITRDQIKYRADLLACKITNSGIKEDIFDLTGLIAEYLNYCSDGSDKEELSNCSEDLENMWVDLTEIIKFLKS